MAKVFQVDTGGTLTTSLDAYYKFDTDGSDFWSTNNLTNNNSVSFASAGKVGNDATFNGTTNYLSRAAPVSTATTAFSCAFWVNVQSTSAAVGWVKNGNDQPNPNSTGWAIGQGATTIYSAGAKVVVVNSTVAWLNSSTSLTTGWHFIVLTKNSSNVWNIWIDNVQDANSMTGAMGHAPDTKFEVGRAQENGGGFSYFNGPVDELALWDKTLSSQEISDLYNGGSGQTMVTQTTTKTLAALGVG